MHKHKTHQLWQNLFKVFNINSVTVLTVGLFYSSACCLCKHTDNCHNTEGNYITLYCNKVQNDCLCKVCLTFNKYFQHLCYKYDSITADCGRKTSKLNAVQLPDLADHFFLIIIFLSLSYPHTHMQKQLVVIDNVRVV